MSGAVNTADVLIVGAGMAGLTLACALVQSGETVADLHEAGLTATDTQTPPLKIVVIDPQVPAPSSQWPVTFDPRVSALTHASENILRRLGVWEAMAQHRVAAFTHMDVWDGDGTGNIQFHADQAGVEQLGHLVENRVTTFCLFEKMRSLPNVEFIQAGLARIVEAEPALEEMARRECGRQDSYSGWRVTLTDGTQLQPRLLIGADGANSRVRDQLGFRCRTWAYGQSAIVTTVTHEKPHGDTARQVFLESGPLAFLPLRQTTHTKNSNISSIVWSLENEQAKTIMALDDATFLQQLTRAFEGRLGKVIATDKRFCFPLTQNHAVDYVLPGVALIGDAAHTIHPLAGQGINLGFLDAAVLAEEILRAHASGLPIDDFSVLRKFQRRRKPHNLLMMSAMEGFKRLFGIDVPPLRVARNLGMAFFNRHTLIKNEIMQRAMGLDGDLPALAQPGLIADF